MTEDQLNPEICPGALDEDGVNRFTDEEGGGRHKWDETTTPQTCAECGTTRDKWTDPDNAPCPKCGDIHGEILDTGAYRCPACNFTEA